MRGHSQTFAQELDMRVLLTDLRHAWRMALRQPVATLSIIALLALGIGGMTAVFNPIYSTIFAPLPFPQPEQLARIGGDLPVFNVPASSFEEESLGRIFSHTTAYSQSSIEIRIPDTGRETTANSLIVTESFFETFGVQPWMGSGLSCKENMYGYVISHRFWRNELARKTDAVGSHIFLGNRLITIVGIMPNNFNFPFDTDIWRCNIRESGSWFDPYGGETQFIGRLRSGMASEQAATELQAVFKPMLVAVQK